MSIGTKMLYIGPICDPKMGFTASRLLVDESNYRKQLTTTD